MPDAYLNLTQAAKAAGITRRTLYNHINQGKITASRDEKNNPTVNVSELIRVYGNVSLPVKKIPTISQRENSHQNIHNRQLEAIQQELAELKQAVTLMLEDKDAREKDRRQHDEERSQLREDVKRLSDALEQERKKGFWSRFFR